MKGINHATQIAIGTLHWYIFSIMYLNVFYGTQFKKRTFPLYLFMHNVNLKHLLKNLTRKNVVNHLILYLKSLNYDWQ